MWLDYQTSIALHVHFSQLATSFVVTLRKGDWTMKNGYQMADCAPVSNEHTNEAGKQFTEERTNLGQ